MSRLPFEKISTTNQDQDFHELLIPNHPFNLDEDSSWPLYQERLMHLDSLTQNQLMNGNDNLTGVNHLSLDKGLKSMRISNPDSKKRKKNTTRSSIANRKNDEVIEEKTTNEHRVVEEQGPSDTKKLDHNAKERIRRMKLNASYLALRALLPNSRRSKKRWSAPSIVDRVLKYIPEMEIEIEELKSKKETILQLSEAKNKRIINVDDNPISQYQSPTISLNEINQDEVIVQICLQRLEAHINGSKSAFTDFLQRLEEDESIISIKSVSSVDVCESRICFHLHIQLNQSCYGSNHIEELRNKLTSWLR